MTLVWASEKLFTKLVEEFYPPVIKDFIGYVNKGERYPLIHAIFDLRVRVFQEKLGSTRRKKPRPVPTAGISVRRSLKTSRCSAQGMMN